jgi:hypothetical protein
MKIGTRAESLIINFEGIDVPWQWPGGSSGITIPVGYDMGYEPFSHDWSGLLDSKDFNRLKAVAGLKGRKAEAVAHTLRGIHIPKEAYLKVFNSITLPRYEALTIQTFPGCERLHPDAFGALVSLIFNRGADLHDVPGRKPRGEMRSIYQVLRQADGRITPAVVNRIADLVEAQARYWTDDKNSDGDLHDRRIDEANLIRATA